MQITTDSKFNVGYVRIIPESKVAYSLEFDENFVADFDDKDNLVGIELLDAKSYKPGDLQSLMSRANAEAMKQRGEGNSEPTGKRSA
jgi:hypothetical protein